MSKIIAIDAGHGLYTAGKRCLRTIDPGETREWWLNDRIADRLEELLKDYDCSIVRVDDTTGIKDISLGSRVRTANSANADIYISIHHNAGINGGSGGGTTVYYCAGAPRPQQAQRLYNAVIAKTGLVGNRSSKVIKHGFYVVKNTKMPAFLLENGYMDSTKDTPIILTKEHAYKTAEGIALWLAEELKLSKVSDKKDTEKYIEEIVIYYPAYTGKTLSLVDALKSLGITSTYTHRCKIAQKNGIVGYTGTAAQNTHMYNLLKAGLLKRV